MSHRVSVIAGMVGVAVVSLSTGVSAQTLSSAAQDRRDAEVDAALEAVRRATAPGAFDALVDAPINFDDLVATPDDTVLNVAYARKQLAAGRPELAGPALERVLLTQPEIDSVRLLYAITLYQLGAYGESRRELEVLIAREPTAQIESTARKYLTAVNDRTKTLRFEAVLSTGVHFDTNRDATPSNDRVLVLDTKVPTGRDERADFGFLTVAGIEARYDTGGQRLQEIRAEGQVFYDQQLSVDSLDATAVLLEVEARIETDVLTLKPALLASMVTLSQEPYRWQGAARLRAERRALGPFDTVYAEVEGGWEDFQSTDGTPFAGERDGAYASITLGAVHQFGNDVEGEVWTRFHWKDADFDFEQYLAFAGGGRLSAALPNDAFVVASVEGEYRDYDGADPFITRRREREDFQFDASLTLGQRLGSLFGFDGGGPVGQALAGTVATAQAGWFSNSSNIPNYDFTSIRAQVMLTRAWRF